MLLAFRANEAERKMREAIARLDLEAAIPLRDEWRQLQADHAEIERQALAVMADRKVISLSTRLPIETAPEVNTVIDLVEPTEVEAQAEVFAADPEETALLAFIADELNAGRLSGLIIFAGHREEDGSIDIVSSWNTTPAWDNMQKYLGAFAECQHDMLAVTGDDYEAVPDEQK